MSTSPGDVSEYTRTGICFKKLEYDELGFLWTKTLLSPDGSVVKKQTAGHDGEEIKANNK
jgi:hypothetical protein